MATQMTKNGRLMIDKKPLKQGLFDYDTLTVKFGGEKTKPEFCFTATAFQVPPYKYQVWEREDAGGGWYGAKELVTKTADRNYLIIRDNVCIGVMYHPYHFGIRTELHPIDEKTDIQIRNCLSKLNLPYSHYISNKSPNQ